MYLIGDALSKVYGLFGGFLLIFSLNAFIYLFLVAETGDEHV